MPSQSLTDTIVIVQGDVLFVAQQISMDLQMMQHAYPDKLTAEEVLRLFNCYSSFMANYAVSWLGFSIYDPLDRNQVYCEYRYEVLYGSEVRRLNPDGRPVRMTHPLLKRSYIPSSARFSAWLTWSNHMLGLSTAEQARIVSGTEWSLPGQTPTLDLRYDGVNWEDPEWGGRGDIGVRRGRGTK